MLDIYNITDLALNANVPGITDFAQNLLDENAFPEMVSACGDGPEFAALSSVVDRMEELRGGWNY